MMNRWKVAKSQPVKIRSRTENTYNEKEKMTTGKKNGSTSTTEVSPWIPSSTGNADTSVLKKAVSARLEKTDEGNKVNIERKDTRATEETSSLDTPDKDKRKPVKQSRAAEEGTLSTSEIQRLISKDENTAYKKILISKTENNHCKRSRKINSKHSSSSEEGFQKIQVHRKPHGVTKRTMNAVTTAQAFSKKVTKNRN